MRTKALLVIFWILISGQRAGAEVNPSKDGAMLEAKKSGFTVAVEFDVDSAGVVSNAKVIKSEAAVLDEFALSSVAAGRLTPQPLPAPGSEPKHVSSELFFPVEPYNSGKSLPVGLVWPVAKFQPSPAYPFEYFKGGITGGVRLAITIDEGGMVTACKVIKASHPAFGPAARQAVEKWIFRPAKLNGKSVAVTLNVPISFQLAGKTHGWAWLVAPEPSLPTFAVIAEALFPSKSGQR